MPTLEGKVFGGLVVVEGIVIFGILRRLGVFGFFRLGPVAVRGWGKHVRLPANDVIQFALVAAAALQLRLV